MEEEFPERFQFDSALSQKKRDLEALAKLGRAENIRRQAKYEKAGQLDMAIAATVQQR